MDESADATTHRCFDGNDDNDGDTATELIALTTSTDTSWEDVNSSQIDSTHTKQARQA